MTVISILTYFIDFILINKLQEILIFKIETKHVNHAIHAI